MYIKSENQSQLITFENKVNSPRTKETTDKETKQEKKDENSPNSDKKDQQTKEDDNQQQNQSQKIDNEENNNIKNIFYRVEVFSLILVTISIAIV